MKKGFNKFDKESSVVKNGDIFYKFDIYDDELPPLKLTLTKMGEIIYNDGNNYTHFGITYPDIMVEKWKKEYGTSKQKWKKFQEELDKPTWAFIDDLYIKTDD